MIEKMKSYVEARKAAKAKKIESLKGRIEEKVRILESTDPIAVSIEPFEKTAYMYERLERNREEILQKLENYADTKTDSPWLRKSYMILEFAIGVYFIYFLLYRIMGEEYFVEMMPKMGVDDSFVLPMIIGMEGVMIVAFSTLAQRYIEGRFDSETKRRLKRFFVTSLGVFVIALSLFLFSSSR